MSEKEIRAAEKTIEKFRMLPPEQQRIVSYFTDGVVAATESCKASAPEGGEQRTA